MIQAVSECERKFCQGLLGHQGLPFGFGTGAEDCMQQFLLWGHLDFFFRHSVFLVELKGYVRKIDLFPDRTRLRFRAEFAAVDTVELFAGNGTHRHEFGVG